MKLIKITRKLAVVSVALTVAMLGGGAAFAYFTSPGGGTGAAAVGTAADLNIHQIGSTVYDSTVAPLAPNLASIGAEAYNFDELGNEITPVSSSSPLSTVVVDMSSWACESGAVSSTNPCVTTAGSTYPVPITLNIYNPASPVGKPIATVTQTFNIPYRPSADATNCPGAKASEWYDTATKTCFNGLLSPITFNFSSLNVVLPSPFVYGIAYNTDHYGYKPLATTGNASPTDSLNVALATEPTNVTVGSDTVPGKVYIAPALTKSELTCATSLTPGVFQQFDVTGTGSCGLGLGTTPATNYIPAVQFNVTNSVTPNLYPGGSPQPINFTVDNPGSVSAHLGSVDIAVATNPATLDVESTPGDANSDVPGCKASWFGFNNVPVVENTSIPTGHTNFLSGTTGASIYMTETHTNQDACQGASVGLVFTSN